MSKKNIIIIVGVVLIVLAVIGGGFFMLWQKLSTLDKPQGEESGRSSEKSTHGGMGLGLYITRACAQKMGGELKFGSTKAGSVFSLRLPWREAPPPPPPAPTPAVALLPQTVVTSGS